MTKTFRCDFCGEEEELGIKTKEWTCGWCFKKHYVEVIINTHKNRKVKG